MLGKTYPLFAAVISILFSTTVLATFIDPKDIKNPYEVFSARDANMTKQEFDEVIQKARDFYNPIVQSHGGRLVINGRWDDDTLNANASQFFGTWNVNMYGGLARHPEMTLDGFAMVLCHEMGHHLAGFTFRKGFAGFGGTWAANEGQSDYFAAHSCARELWKDDLQLNATFKDQVPESVLAACDTTWTTEDERNLCYRINAGGESLARVLSALAKDEIQPDFETPDINKSDKVDDSHPAAQCRLDTTYAASLCQANFDPRVIPGKDKSDPFGKDAEMQASQYTCMEYSGFQEGLRPRCWFRPGI